MGNATFCLNAAVEESTIADRERKGPERLHPQDIFIRDHITENDYLVVSVGGNDIALAPGFFTIVNMAVLTYLVPTWAIRRGKAITADSINFGFGSPPGLSYFVHLFRVRAKKYVEELVSINKPKKILLCMIYYLDEKVGGSWADTLLKLIGYNSNPTKLQITIAKIFELASKDLHIDGTVIEMFPLFKVLDGKDTDDYVQRVEPSVIGGKKMGTAIVEALCN